MSPAIPDLLDAIRSAPRRYRMPALPPDAGSAEAAGPETALAFTIAQLRRAHETSEGVPCDLQRLFVRSLSALVVQALRTIGGDPAFQALVMAGQEPSVAQYLALAAQEGADRRRLRAAIDAFAHPGKLRIEADTVPEALAQLHASAHAGDWSAAGVAAQALAGTRWQAHAAPVLADPALHRLQRIGSLRSDAMVQRYLALCAARGPVADTRESAAYGRAAARAGAASEEATVRAFGQLAASLDHAGLGRHRVVRGLRLRSGLPPAAPGAKDEWDVTLLRTRVGTDALELVLLAEVKASPASAVSDWPRLRRGLHGLAQVPPGTTPVFSAADGDVRIEGDSLRALMPPGDGLPAQVIYCCTGQETRVPLLSAPARAKLLQHPCTVAHARALAQGDPAAADLLAPLWEALPRSPQLRSVTEQDEIARAARDAMLHPDDLQDIAHAR